MRQFLKRATIPICLVLLGLAASMVWWIQSDSKKLLPLESAGQASVGDANSDPMDGFLGQARCAECHIDIHHSHIGSPHAGTFSLARDSQTAAKFCDRQHDGGQPYGTCHYACDEDVKWTPEFGPVAYGGIERIKLRLNWDWLEQHFLERKMTRKRRSFTSSLKRQRSQWKRFGELKTVSQLAQHHKVHPNQVMQWKRQLLESAAHLCEGRMSKAVNCDEPPFSYFYERAVG